MLAKRIFDLVASLAGLGLTAPLLILIAVLVKLDSSGPIFFRQERMGRGFQPFQLIKFRSMAVDAARRGPMITVGGDARVTRVGRWLRRTKLDELPQLINVVRGEMSLVGPRPEVRKYVEMFRAEYEEILSVPPGITDYAAIEFRNEEEVLRGYADPESGYVSHVLPAKIVLYRRYLRERGVLADLKILVATAARVVKSG